MNYTPQTRSNIMPAASEARSLAAMRVSTVKLNILFPTKSLSIIIIKRIYLILVNYNHLYEGNNHHIISKIKKHKQTYCTTSKALHWLVWPCVLNTKRTFVSLLPRWKKCV